MFERQTNSDETLKKMKILVKVVKRQSWDKDVDVFGINVDIDKCIQKEGSQTFICELIAKSLTREIPLMQALEEGYRTHLTENEIENLKTGNGFHGHAEIENKDSYSPFSSFVKYDAGYMKYDEKVNKLTILVDKMQLKEGYTLEQLQKEAEAAFKFGSSYSNYYAFERID